MICPVDFTSGAIAPFKGSGGMLVTAARFSQISHHTAEHPLPVTICE